MLLISNLQEPHTPHHSWLISQKFITIHLLRAILLILVALLNVQLHRELCKTEVSISLVSWSLLRWKHHVCWWHCSNPFLLRTQNRNEKKKRTTDTSDPVYIAVTLITPALSLIIFWKLSWWHTHLNCMENISSSCIYPIKLGRQTQHSTSYAYRFWIRSNWIAGSHFKIQTPRAHFAQQLYKYIIYSLLPSHYVFCFLLPRGEKTLLGGEVSPLFQIWHNKAH